MLWIALVVGVLWTVKAAKRTDIKPDHVIDVSLWALIVGVITAHLTSVFLDYLHNPSGVWGLWGGLLSPSGGIRGLSFHGGLIGGIGSAYLYARRKKINFLALADLCSPALALAYGITRIGCFLNGCCYGIPTQLPWAVRFHTDAVSGGLTPPSHPTQIYAMLASFLIFLILLGVQVRRRFVGQVFLSYIAMYSVYRFLIEFLRKGVTAEIAFAGLTQAQIASLILMAISIPLLLMKQVKRDAGVEPQSRQERKGTP
jgi:phosphatidylglycerol:prolipoprotein diacylglycerol transferase